MENPGILNYNLPKDSILDESHLITAATSVNRLWMYGATF